MRVVSAVFTVVAIAAFPWFAWAMARGVWLRWRERRVLAVKYGDLEMFSRRLDEWKVPRDRAQNHDGST